MSLRRAWLMAMAFAVSWSWLTHAASVTVNPVRVHLSEAAPGQSVSVYNTGAVVARFQVKAYAWQQSTSGEMELSPTSDLAIFPTLLQIDPGQTRRIRITSGAASPAREQTYRIFIEELPPLQRDPAQAIQMLTRFGIPIFLQPKAPVAHPRLRIAAAKKKVVLSLDNSGNSYFVAQTVEVEGRSRDGKRLFQQSLPAWYVLAGGLRQYEVPIADGACAELGEVSATTTTDHGNLEAHASIGPGLCGD